MRRSVWMAGAAVVVVGAVTWGAWERWRAIGPFSGEARWVLSGAERFELMALDPSHEDFDARRAGTMHGYRILGRAEVTDAGERRRLVEGVYAGVKAEGVAQAKCFNPRQALRAERGGRVVEVLVCFECRGVEVFEDGVARGGSVAMGDGARGVFEEAVGAAGLGVATEGGK